jgi:hypothetical protein
MKAFDLSYAPRVQQGEGVYDLPSAKELRVNPGTSVVIVDHTKC